MGLPRSAGRKTKKHYRQNKPSASSFSPRIASLSFGTNGRRRGQTAHKRHAANAIAFGALKGKICGSDRIEVNGDEEGRESGSGCLEEGG